MSEDIAKIWRDTAAEARTLVDAGRQPFAPIEQLSALYRRLDAHDQVVANGLIAADLDSEDTGVRYDAMWLIREFAIGSAAPALRTLASRLESSSEVGASFELEKVERLLREICRAWAWPCGDEDDLRHRLQQDPSGICLVPCA